MNKLSGILLVLFAVCSPLSRPAAAENRTLTLNEAVQLALERSPDVLLTESQTQRAEAALKETRSLNLPKAAVGAGAAYNNGFPLSIEGSAPSIFKFEASQPVFSAQNKNLIREAGESVKAGRLGSDISRNELAAKVALVYAQLDQARKIEALARERLDAAEKQRSFTEILVKDGRARPIDAATAKAAVTAAKHQIFTAREQADAAEAELRELTGLSEDISIQTVAPIMESPVYAMEVDALFQKTAADSPEIQQAEAKIRAKEFHVMAEKAARHPRLAAVAEYSLLSRSNNYEDFYHNFERHNYLIGISAQVPLDVFKTNARVAKSRVEVSEEQYRLQSLKSDLKINIRKALSVLRIAQNALDVAQSDLEVAREMIPVNSVLLENGRISEKEMEESRLRLREKELAALEAEHALFQRKLELLRVTGSVLTAFQ